ncbi:MAG: response regulator [Nitrospinaceae bacterium]|nr:response regulator [Nitrospinaceae bacterium]
MTQKILIIEDEADIRELLAYNLAAEGFEVEEASTGADALEAIRERKHDLLLLDLMLPDVSGLDICRTVRQSLELRDLPIIMVTARGGEMDRIVGLELGADDYVVKPFSVREVILRVKSVLNRSEGKEVPGQSKIIHHGVLEINFERHEVIVENKQCILTATEFKLLQKLISRVGVVHSRDVLLDAVWGLDAFVTQRTVDTHIRRLRDKLGPAALMIETIRGVGYRFVPSSGK